MKSILITGSTDGIGKLTAIKLAKEGHQVLLHGRNREKLENTIAETKKIAENDKVSGFVANLSDFSSIYPMISQLSSEISAVDVLINNAGVFNSSVDRNQDGLDLRFVVNYFAPYLLTNELIPLLEKSTSPRVINLSSAAQATVSLRALAGKEQLSTQEAYAQSKLALTMWSFYLSEEVKFLNVIAVNPGSLLNTKMVQEAYGRYWSSADKGADILYELTVSDKYANSSGKYFDNDLGAFADAHPDVYREDRIKKLISETNKILA